VTSIGEPWAARPPRLVRTAGRERAAACTQSTQWTPTAAVRWHSGHVGRPHRWHITYAGRSG
jgi:hypothetical protein